MTDPKTTAPSPAKAASPVKKDDDAVVIPPKSTSPAATPATPASRSMSSVGAELHPDATTKKVDGKLALDAGGPLPSAAPDPTPAEVVLYPSTGGLPDTGPNSKYVLGEDRGPELYNRDGVRVNADGQPIDVTTGAVLAEEEVVIDRRVTDKNMQKQREYVSPQTKAEMEAGAKALANR